MCNEDNSVKIKGWIKNKLLPGHKAKYKNI